MRARTRSEPDWTGRCRWWQTAGNAAQARTSWSVTPDGWPAGNGCDRLQQAGERLREPAGARRVGCVPDRIGAPVVHNALAEQGDLAHAVADERVDFGEDFACRPAVFGAPHIRHDAIGATSVAAEQDRHKRGKPGIGVGFDNIGHLVEVGRFEQPAFSGEDAGEQARDCARAARADREIKARHAREDPGAQPLRHAAHEAHAPVRPVAFAGAEQPELAERFVLGFGSHAAGIDHDQVSILFALDRRVAGGLKQGGDRFGIADVHLASVGVENKAHGSQGFAVLEVSAGSALPEKPSVIFSMMLT